jgi:hypothetical protein
VEPGRATMESAAVPRCYAPERRPRAGRSRMT